MTLIGDSISSDPFIQNESDEPLASLIPRIIAERESFLNLTEHLLQQEIEQQDGSGSTIEVADETKATSVALGLEEVTSELLEEQATEYETFQKKKGQLLNYIGSALNETSLSLDFVSLLLSAVKPGVAKTTLSPHLSKNSPLGSLGADKLKNNPSQSNGSGSEIKKHSTEKIGMGWKYQSLANINNLYKSAATSLRAEVASEHEYWKTIHCVYSHGEALCRIRDSASNAKAIGVKYGYSDSGLNYFDKGLAVLRKSNNGSIHFVPLTSRTSRITGDINRFTRIRILSKIDDDYMLTGQSLFSKDELKQRNSDQIVNNITKARYFIFEDDLFYHLLREAKNLISYNVSMISNKIIIEIRDQIIEIETVIYDEENEEELNNVYQNTNQESSKNNRYAQDILVFLKLMLCCYYNYNLLLKHKMPTSHTKWKQTHSHPLLLRPLVGLIRHEINVRSSEIILRKICMTFDSSVVSFEIKKIKNYNLRNVDPCANPFIKAILKPVTVFEVVLLKNATLEHIKAEIEVTSSEIFVNLIVKIRISKYKSLGDLQQNNQGKNVLQLELTDLLEVEESLSWTFASFATR